MSVGGDHSQEHSTWIELEVCIDTVESAIAAVKGGATRLELCGSLGAGGGITPTLGLFRAVINATSSDPSGDVVAQRGRIPVMVMIRPRTGDFVYTDWELDIMQEDIRIFKNAGADGVVFGILNPEGDIDVVRSTQLVREAHPMQVCFHRAFDMTRDVRKAFEDVRRIPHVTRILTSGHGPTCTAPLSLSTLATLLRTLSCDCAQHSLSILPGSGISAATVRPVLAQLLPLGLREIHMSGGGWVPSEMRFRKESMGMGEWAVWRTSEEQVRGVARIVREMYDQFQELQGKDIGN